MLKQPKSYAQQGEDLIVWNIFQAQRWEGKSILEIGAFSPFSLSNSRLFIEQGWRAILVEPSPRPLDSLLLEYGNSEQVTILAAAVMPKFWACTSRFAPLTITADAVSTTCEWVRETWEKAGGYYARMQSAVVSADEIVGFYGPFDLISIDAEGLSMEIAESLFVNIDPKLYPKVMIIEHDGRPHSNLIKMLAGLGTPYSAAACNDTNLILKKEF
jgi:hypothetical protein